MRRNASDHCPFHRNASAPFRICPFLSPNHASSHRIASMMLQATYTHRDTDQVKYSPVIARICNNNNNKSGRPHPHLTLVSVVSRLTLVVWYWTGCNVKWLFKYLPWMARQSTKYDRKCKTQFANRQTTTATAAAAAATVDFQCVHWLLLRQTVCVCANVFDESILVVSTVCTATNQKHNRNDTHSIYVYDHLTHARCTVTNRRG